MAIHLFISRRFDRISIAGDIAAFAAIDRQMQRITKVNSIVFFMILFLSFDMFTYIVTKRQDLMHKLKDIKKSMHRNDAWNEMLIFNYTFESVSSKGSFSKSPTLTR